MDPRMQLKTSHEPSKDEAHAIIAMMREVVVLLSRDASILFANPAAKRLLSRHDPLTVRGGRLIIDSREGDKLPQAINCACTVNRRGLEALVIRQRDGSPMVLSVRCLDDSGRGVILLLGSDPGVESALVLQTLRRCFGLTTSEARVAAAVAAGLSSERIAAERGVQITTVRSQVKAIAAKLGCTTKSQISTIVRTTPLSHGDPE